jgi:hypothetical protein
MSDIQLRHDHPPNENGHGSDPAPPAPIAQRLPAWAVLALLAAVAIAVIVSVVVITNTGAEGAGVSSVGGESVDEWVEGRTSTTGAAYIGLTLDQATARASANGLTTRVVGVDGRDLPVTKDLRKDRLDLMVFEDREVAAQLPTEPAIEHPHDARQ